MKDVDRNQPEPSLESEEFPFLNESIPRSIILECLQRAVAEVAHATGSEEFDERINRVYKKICRVLTSSSKKKIDKEHSRRIRKKVAQDEIIERVTDKTLEMLGHDPSLSQKVRKEINETLKIIDRAEYPPPPGFIDSGGWMLYSAIAEYLENHPEIILGIVQSVINKGSQPN